jgi:N,N-dimethylformamidase beta subunit-like, C-terminal
MLIATQSLAGRVGKVPGALRSGLRVVFVALMLLTMGIGKAEAFFPWKTGLSPTDRWQFVVGDLNRDGNDDVVGYHPEIGTIWFGRNSDSEFEFVRGRQSAQLANSRYGWRLVAIWCPSQTLASHLVFYGTRTGDLSVGTVRYRRLSDGGTVYYFASFGHRGRVPGSNFAGWQFTVEDFDNDGEMDVMGYDPSDGSLNFGRRHAFEFAFDSEPWAVVTPHRDWTFSVGNFNNDEKPDVLGYHPSDGSLHVGINTGRGFSFRELEVGLGEHARFVVGNFYSQNRSDIIRYDVDTGDLYRGVNALDSDAMRRSFAYSGPWSTVPGNHRRDWQLFAGNFFGDSNTDLMLYDPHNGVLWVGNDRQEFEGYAWPLSAEPGQGIDFFVSGIGNPYVEFYRHTSVGRTVRSDLMESPPPRFFPKVQFTDARPWRNGAGWTRSFPFRIPEDWRSGIYSARLSNAVGGYSHIAFVVKPRPSRRSGLAVLANVNTWLAYNRWGGKGKYSHAGRVSFLRPNRSTKPTVELREDETNRDLTTGFSESPVKVGTISNPLHLTRGELWILGFLELIGRSPDVYTDIDFHNGVIREGGYKVLVLSTHPEYWTETMYSNLRTFLDEGGSLLYLGGNGIYERGRYVSDQQGMEFGRGTDRESDASFNRSLFRMIGLPERALLGVGTEACKVYGSPYRLAEEATGHDVFRGIPERNLREFGGQGLNTGCEQCNGAASAWEVDTRNAAGRAIPSGCRATDETVPRGGGPPVDPTLLAVARDANGKGAEMVFYDHPGRGFVFSVGSITFGGSLVVDFTLSTIVGNVVAMAEERARSLANQ